MEAESEGWAVILDYFKRRGGRGGVDGVWFFFSEFGFSTVIAERSSGWLWANGQMFSMDCYDWAWREGGRKD